MLNFAYTFGISSPIMTQSVNVRLRNQRATVFRHVAATEEKQQLKLFATVTTNRVKTPKSD